MYRDRSKRALRFNRDGFHMVDCAFTAQSAMHVVDAMQSYRPEAQVAGVAAAFLLLCEAHGISPPDAAQAVSNIIHDSEGRLIPEFRAVRRYYREEV